MPNEHLLDILTNAQLQEMGIWAYRSANSDN